jgi:hypothetical protein
MSHERQRHVPEKTKDKHHREAEKAKFLAKASAVAPIEHVSSPVFIRNWHKLSFAQKCLFWFAIFAVSGISARLIYQFVVGYTHSFDLHMQNALNASEVEAFKASKGVDKKVTLSDQLSMFVKQAGVSRQHAQVVGNFRTKVRDVVESEVTTVLDREVFHQKDFKIEVALPAELQGGDAGFVGALNKILIGVDDKKTDDDIRVAFRNERHHARLRWWNRIKGCNNPQDERLLSEPFCDQKSRLVKAQGEGLKKAIIDANQKITAFYQRWLADPTSAEIKQQLEALQYYRPLCPILYIPKAQFEEQVRKGLVVKSKHLGIDYESPKHTLPGKLVTDRYYIGVKTEGNEVVLRQTHARDTQQSSVVKAFMSDWVYLFQLTVEAPGALYGQKGLSEYSRYAELASNIDEFENEVKHVFFGDYCKFFSDYFEIDDYCPRQRGLSK